MYTATKKEIAKFMKNIDMSYPHTVNGIINSLRDDHNRHWFEEEKIMAYLEQHKAEKVMIEDKPYYRINDWNVI